jgi:hypothetical protein
MRAKHKRFSDFRALAAELAARVLPALPTPPAAALVTQTQELCSTSAEGARLLSGEHLGDYLQLLVEGDSPELLALLAAWLFPGAGLCPELLFLDADAAVIGTPAAAGAAAAASVSAADRGSSTPKGHRCVRISLCSILQGETDTHLAFPSSLLANVTRSVGS